MLLAHSFITLLCLKSFQDLVPGFSYQDTTGSHHLLKKPPLTFKETESSFVLLTDHTCHTDEISREKVQDNCDANELWKSSLISTISPSHAGSALINARPPPSYRLCSCLGKIIKITVPIRGLPHESHGSTI